jgi:pimeloyl-ACP methyl ester carboxylesterase
VPDRVTTELVRIAVDAAIVLDGACWSPAGAARKTAIVIAPGTGGEFCHPPMATLGPLLAAEGWRVLALNRRDHGGHFGFHRFRDAALDHRYAVDFLAGRGAARVVLGGHSYGTLAAPAYVAETDDARVAALLLLAPLGDLRAASTAIVGGTARYDAIVAECRRRIADGDGDAAFVIPPMVPGGMPLVHSHAVFMDKRGPAARTVGPELIARAGTRPLLGIRDPADLYPATLPPAQERLQAANPRLDYVLLPDRRGGRMDAEAHAFAGREAEVVATIAGWLARHGLDR